MVETSEYGKMIAKTGENLDKKRDSKQIGLNKELQEPDSRIMIKDNELKENDLDNICDECKNEDESVSQNLILTGFKICKSCRISKTIFPI